MNFNLPQAYFNRLMSAIAEFNLIESNDRILIGLSGGKDSVFLAYALACLKKRLRKQFDLAAITIDPMFTETFDTNRIKAFCDSLDMPYHVRAVDIAGTIREQGGKDPCFTCAFFRRGAINRFARENGYHKIAYAHHHDDAVETFLMSLMYSGQLKTFLPRTYLSRARLTVIRPLIYFRESELKETAPLHEFAPVESPCPLNGKTKRQEAKELIAKLAEGNPAIYDHLAAGMRKSALIELWPPKPDRHEMKRRYNAFMFGKKDGPAAT